jgi:hypothetical protein
MMVGRRRHVVTVFTVALVVVVFFGVSASSQNAKDCAADKTCTEDPKRTMTTTIEPKKASTTTTTTMDPKKSSTTTSTMDPKKATTTITIEPKKVTTTANPKKAGTTITAKSTLKTPAAVFSTGSDGDGVLHHYNTSGRDSDYKSADLKEIVVLDVPATADADKTVDGLGNATVSAPGAVGVKPDVNTSTEMTSSTTVTSASKTTVATLTNNSIAANSTTTESTTVSQLNIGVVRFVDHVYCACDLIVSFYFHFLPKSVEENLVSHQIYFVFNINFIINT